MPVLRSFAPLTFFFAIVVSISGCGVSTTGNCVCRLDPQHPDSGIITCEGTIGGGQPEQCKLEDEAGKKPHSEISVICDPDSDPDDVECSVIE